MNIFYNLFVCVWIGVARNSTQSTRGWKNTNTDIDFFFAEHNTQTPLLQTFCVITTPTTSEALLKVQILHGLQRDQIR